MGKRLEGKTAIVTAAAQGIGRATAIQFAQEGCKVVACDINIQLLDDLKAIPGIEVKQLDVLQKNQIETLAKSVEKLDILFNCVGYVHQGTILECDEDTWNRSFNLNVRSMYYMCQALIPSMIANGGGSIINMSSVVSSIMGAKSRFAYGTTKAAVIGLTKSLAVEYVENKIRVNTVCPGTVETPSWRERCEAHADPVEARKKFIARQKMGRLGTAEEIAHIVTYLASDESSYATGQEFVVDGGMSL